MANTGPRCPSAIVPRLTEHTRISLETELSWDGDQQGVKYLLNKRFSSKDVSSKPLSASLSQLGQDIVRGTLCQEI